MITPRFPIANAHPFPKGKSFSYGSDDLLYVNGLPKQKLLRSFKDLKVYYPSMKSSNLSILEEIYFEVINFYQEKNKKIIHEIFSLMEEGKSYFGYAKFHHKGEIKPYCVHRYISIEESNGLRLLPKFSVVGSIKKVIQEQQDIVTIYAYLYRQINTHHHRCSIARTYLTESLKNYYYDFCFKENAYKNIHLTINGRNYIIVPQLRTQVDNNIDMILHDEMDFRIIK